MTLPVRPRVVMYAAIPLLAPFGALLYFSAECHDDWCVGGRWEAAAYDLGFSLLVVAAVAYYSTRPISGLRAGLSGWSLAFAVAGMVFMASQLYERDLMVAMVWAWLSGCLAVATVVLARPRPNRAAPEPVPRKET